MAAHALLQALNSESRKNDVRPEAMLGSEGFPESQVAAFFLDAMRVGPPLLPSVPITVSPEITAKVDLNVIHTDIGFTHKYIKYFVLILPRPGFEFCIVFSMKINTIYYWVSLVLK